MKESFFTLFHCQYYVTYLKHIKISMRTYIVAKVDKRVLRLRNLLVKTELCIKQLRT